MKTLIATATLALTLAAPAFAEINVQQFLALSNDSAAERIVGETSSGNRAAIEVEVAMGNMSAAERMVYQSSDNATRAQIIAAKMKLIAGESPAELSATF